MRAKIAFFLACKKEQLRRRILAAIIRLKNRGGATFTVIRQEPTIVLAAFNWDSAQIKSLPKGSLLLLQLYHSAESDDEVALVGKRLNFIRNQNPNTKIIVLTNTAQEESKITRIGFEAAHINHNAFVDEAIFSISPCPEKLYDAIYDAQLSPYKRHYLARTIPSLALISYIHRPCPDLAYARAIRRELNRATWINDPLEKNYRKLPHHEVAKFLNSSRSGLCLSEVEGAMYASVQYLLCGLPVVTTPNQGGRDEFFEPEFALQVAPTTEAVELGVAKMAYESPDPEYIRQQTLSKVIAIRSHFCDLVQLHLKNAGISDDFEITFRKAFFNTMVKRRNLKELRNLK